uniref:Uncharacterized protein n=1 Tax=Oryza punctata TaxID=4537 RepID=A0A0E0KI22_ORYPU
MSVSVDGVKSVRWSNVAVPVSMDVRGGAACVTRAREMKGRERVTSGPHAIFHPGLSR